MSASHKDIGSGILGPKKGLHWWCSMVVPMVLVLTLSVRIKSRTAISTLSQFPSRAGQTTRMILPTGVSPCWTLLTETLHANLIGRGGSNTDVGVQGQGDLLGAESHGPWGPGHDLHGSKTLVIDQLHYFATLIHSQYRNAKVRLAHLLIPSVVITL